MVACARLLVPATNALALLDSAGKTVNFPGLIAIRALARMVAFAGYPRVEVTLATVCLEHLAHSVNWTLVMNARVTHANMMACVRIV